MASHLYSGILAKVGWFVRRFGWREVFLKPLRVLFAPLVLRFIKRRRFKWRGADLDGFYHRYNITWAGERLVEVPIARKYLAAYPPESVLEVGNVLRHYGHGNHAVVDKYESGPGVVNSDIVDFSPARRFGLIISISTFEHIGFDDDSVSGSGSKILAATLHCRKLLSADGLFVLTVPLGYNPDLDEIIAKNLWNSEETRCLRRVGFSEWEECSLAETAGYPYRRHFPYANSLAVIEFRCPTLGATASGPRRISP